MALLDWRAASIPVHGRRLQAARCGSASVGMGSSSPSHRDWQGEKGITWRVWPYDSEGRQTPRWMQGGVVKNKVALSHKVERQGRG